MPDTELRELRYRAPLAPTALAAMSAALIALALVMTGALGLISAAHAHYYAVRTDSMAPLFERGDLVVTKAVTQLAVGDAVTFEKYGALVTHRIIAPGREPGTWQTRGDNNHADDPWTITQADVVGRVSSVVHRVGVPLLVLEDPRGRLLLGNGIAGLVILLWWALPRATRVPTKLLHPSNGYAIP